MEVTVIEPTRKTSLKVAAYCRVSTDKDEQQESLEIQKSYYYKKIYSHPGWCFAGIYADEGKTGTSTACRREFNRLIQDARDGKIDVILVKSISRFARNAADCQNYTRELRSMGVEVIFEKDGISNMNPSAEFIFSILAVVAQEESRNISEHVRWTLHKNFEKGIHRLGNNRVLGYDSKNDILVPNKDAWIVKLAFEEYSAGKNLTQVAESLNAAGAKRLRSRKGFDAAAIRLLLRNEIYKGDRLLQKTPPKDLQTYKTFYVSHDHPPIVSEELWNKVQKLMTEGGEGRRLSRGNPNRHPLYGLIFCGECGSPMIRRSIRNRNGTYFKVWKCRGTKIKNGCCNTSYIREEKIHQLIQKKTGAEKEECLHTVLHSISKISVNKYEAHIQMK